MEKLKIAICYDFDKTLSETDMQNYSFMKNLNISIDEFWNECDVFENIHCSDSILTYLYVTLLKCRENGVKPTKDFFLSCGKDVKFFPGVLKWFDRINEFGKNIGVEIEHYIISSGIKENFKEIYACNFCYDYKGEAFWPAVSIDYTNKTQFLFRINKGILTQNDSSVNDYMPHEIRRIPFENMIYIGDSRTDIPSMKLIRSKGGFAIGVYNDDISPIYYKELINLNRVDYIAKADYQKDSELCKIIEQIIQLMQHKYILKKLNHKQKQS